MPEFKYTRFNETPYETHMTVFDLIESNKIILDLGCATGYFAKKLKEKNCITYGVERNKTAARKAKSYCKEVIIGDVSEVSKLAIPCNFFDYILLLDILEHLEKPECTLEAIKKYLKRDGKAIISIPNVAHISVRFNLLLGKFSYSDFGVLDSSHLKFFTKQSFIDLIHKTNFKILHLDYSADFGQLPLLGRIIKKRAKRWQYLATRWLNSLLAVQFVAVCRL